MINIEQINQNKKSIYKNNQGQSLVEFILLISSIMLISLLFLKNINGSIADIWLEMGNILTENPSINLELK